MAQTDGNGEFGTQAKAGAGFALRHEDAAAQVLTGNIKERFGRLNDRRVDALGVALDEFGDEVVGEFGRLIRGMPGSE